MLTERQLLIFQVIIDEFIESAQPVGSRVISQKEDVSLSPATIRNVMAELEEMGFIEKTHTSSGRVPSEKGYRFYVDHITASSNHEIEANIIRNLINDGIYEFEQIVQMTAEILSDLTNYTSIILGPEVLETKLMKLQITTITPQTAVAILITNTGHVEHRSFSIPNNINAADLEKMANILSERLYGVPIIRLSEMLDTELLILMKKYIQNVDQSFEYLKEILFTGHPIKLYIGGKSNILMQPEFKDFDKLYSFYSMMEREEEIVNLLKRSEEGIKVTIGNENEVEAIKDFSVITSPYHLGNDQIGTIALLGPTRMEYKKVIRLLSSISNEMSNVLYMWLKDKK